MRAIHARFVLNAHSKNAKGATTHFLLKIVGGFHLPVSGNLGKNVYNSLNIFSFIAKCFAPEQNNVFQKGPTILIDFRERGGLLF